MRTRHIIVLLAAILLGSCAQDVQVELTQPSSTPQVATVGAGRSITLLRPHDARPNPAVIGEFGQKACFSNAPCPAIARPNSDVAVWIGNAFPPGLEQAGFHVQRAEALDESPTPIAILITVTQASVREEETRIGVTVAGYRLGQTKPLFRRTYSGIASVGGGGTAEGYQDAMKQALQKLIDQAVPNLVQALAATMGG